MPLTDFAFKASKDKKNRLFSSSSVKNSLPMKLLSTIGFHNGAKTIKASHIPRVALSNIF